MSTNTKPHIVVIGSINMDLVVQCERLPTPGETLLGFSMEHLHGGKGANQAVAAARLGGQVSMIGCMGSDAFGIQLREGLIKEGVDTKGVVQHAGETSGVAIIHVDNTGENSITVIPGANALVDAPMVRTYRSIIEHADVVLMQLEIPLTTVQAVLAIAHETGVPVILDPAPIPAEPFPGPLYNVSVFTPNQSETHHLTDIWVDDAASAKDAGMILIERGAQEVLFKAGEHGAFGVSTDGQVIHVPAFKVEVKDTTAAGDAFTAGFAIGTAEGQPRPQAIRLACAAGAIAVSRPGAQPAMPHRQEAEALKTNN